MVIYIQGSYRIFFTHGLLTQVPPPPCFGVVDIEDAEVVRAAGGVEDEGDTKGEDVVLGAGNDRRRL